jgi:hypothetical protein
MKHNISKFWFYLVINIIVSALTTLIVISIWNAKNQNAVGHSNMPTPLPAWEINLMADNIPVPTLPALDEKTLEIKNVYATEDIQTEFIQIQMIGEKELWLTNWQIGDGKKLTYTFPRLQLNSGGTVNLYSKLGVDSVTDLYWGQTESVWQSGDTVLLLDSDDNVRAEYTIP